MTSTTSYFLYDNWLSVDNGIPQTKVNLSALTPDDMKKNSFYQLKLKSSQDLKTNHLWISIISCPAHSTFTRSQRLSCALSLLLTTMLTSIMFYGVPTDDPEDQLSSGGFTISLSDIVIGIESGLLMFPINFIIMQLFTKLAPRPLQRQDYKKAETEDTVQFDDLNDLEKDMVTKSLFTDADDNTIPIDVKEDTCPIDAYRSFAEDTVPIGVYKSFVTEEDATFQTKYLQHKTIYNDNALKLESENETVVRATHIQSGSKSNILLIPQQTSVPKSPKNIEEIQVNIDHDPTNDSTECDIQPSTPTLPQDNQERENVRESFNGVGGSGMDMDGQTGRVSSTCESITGVYRDHTGQSFLSLYPYKDSRTQLAGNYITSNDNPFSVLTFARTRELS